VFLNGHVAPADCHKLLSAALRRVADAMIVLNRAA
jgi:hypothetical protein